MLLLGGHRREARLLLGFEASLLDLGVADGFEAGRLFATTLLFCATPFFFGADARFLGLASGRFGGTSGLFLRCELSGLVRLFAADSVLFQVHQLFER
ncbi:MAG: hypothetical protein JNK04_10220, partial [Myxococcales bacterium]|nr:hypothetical protein [Myxococcales bacterium]